MLTLGLVVQLRLTALHAVQGEAQVSDKGDFNAETFQNNSSVGKLRDAREAGQGPSRRASGLPFPTKPREGESGKAAQGFVL